MMMLMRPPDIWKEKFKNKRKKKENPVDESKQPLVAENSAPVPVSREIKFLKKDEKWNSVRSLQEDINKNFDTVI